MNYRALIVACVLLPVLAFLCGCGNATKSTASPAAKAPLPEEPKLVLLNWEDYMEPEVVRLFEEETGIKVEIVEFGSNNQLEAMFQEDRGAYDLVVVDDSFLQSYVDVRLIRKFDHSLLKNLGNIDSKLVNRPADPNNDYCIPYFYGMTVIGYNKRLVQEPPDSWHDFWDPKYAGKVGLMDDVWDYLALGHLKSLDEYSVGEAETWPQSIKAFESLLPNLGNIGEFNDIAAQIGEGELLIGNCYNGDILYLADDYPDLACVLPKEGAMIWVDSFALCRKSKHPLNAHRFIDFLLRPEICAMNANSMSFPPVVTKALPMLDQALLDNQTIFPPKDQLDKFLSYPLLTPELQTALDTAKVSANKRHQEIKLSGRWTATD